MGTQRMFLKMIRNNFLQLTKAEIIQNSLVKKRIEHRSGWEAEIRRLLS